MLSSLSGRNSAVKVRRKLHVIGDVALARVQGGSDLELRDPSLREHSENHFFFLDMGNSPFP